MKLIVVGEKVIFLCSSVLLSLILLFPTASNADTLMDTSAEVTTGAEVTLVDPLSFGKFTVGNAGGTIQINAKKGGATITTGDVTLLGFEQRGVVNVVGPKASSVLVTVGNTTLTDSVSGLTLDVTNVTCVRTGQPTIGSCSFSMPGTQNTDVGVGGMLSVPANQTPGLYQGIIVVTANIQ